MKKILITLFITLLPFSNIASAQWFGEVRGILPFDSSGSNKGPGWFSGDDGQTAEKDHFGVSLGYMAPNNMSLSLNYEKNDTTFFQNNATFTDGVTYDYVSMGVDIETYMVELAYNHPVNDNFSLVGLAGIGLSEHTVDEFLKFRANGGADRTSARSRYGSETQTSTRIGLGGLFKATDQISITGSLVRTDYGTSQSYNTDTGNPSVAQVTIEDQFILGLRYNF